MDGKERMEELCLEIVEKNEQICTIKFQNFLGAMPQTPILGRGYGAPPQYGGSQKILKFNSANLFIFSTISRHFATSHKTLQQSQLHT